MKKLLIFTLCLSVFLAGCRRGTPEAAVTATVPTVLTTAPAKENSPVMTHR